MLDEVELQKTWEAFRRYDLCYDRIIADNVPQEMYEEVQAEWRRLLAKLTEHYNGDEGHVFFFEYVNRYPDEK